MGASESDQAAARRHLEVAQAGLRRLDAGASTAGGEPAPNLVRVAIKAAMNELDGAVTLLSAPDGIARVSCRFCGRMVMPAATLCGFCWCDLSPKTSG
jgi:hypothetical protein